MDSSQTGAALGLAPLILKAVAMLALVLALLVATAWLVKKLSAAKASSSGARLKVQAACHLGPKERLMVVDADGVRLLLGVTPSGITTLHTYGETGPIESEEAQKPPAFFDALLQKALNKKEDHA